ncbi:hypothetical protein [Aquisalinus flavus]|uniref:Uncharacterized protein n=1 Tax=Aquisalinus flavus TaxID=1526572 RepID=A0A8J2V751_9PROT|nr:hypothetical protein [Aquisalinus flavus]MBD0425649.1 hypothetical protein [Aquisalinus flavus]UNE48735.1 hypothetical protein FF099_12075 [Aquisalinus flavus]GGD14355.1 hypothetical protein GCM10011342_23930 [Aquisalinus flavus]
MIDKHTLFRNLLKSGVAMAGLTAVGVPALAAEADIDASAAIAASVQTPAANAGIEERQQYVLRLMAQVYNGKHDYSHTQLLGVGRIRKDQQSYTMFDYGDGAVVIDKADRLAAGKFLNVSATEKAILYDYDTKTVSGDDEIASFHNTYVRPWMDRAPALGVDTDWSQQLPVSALGVEGLGEGQVTIEMSREYFTHDGMPMVLIHYAVPAFSYDIGSGRTVIHWAQGISMTDPGFGMIYLNSMLHRAVATQDGIGGQPYRYGRVMVAANEDGSAMVDYRDVPQLAPYLDSFFSPEAMRVVPAGTPDETPDERPLLLAQRLDTMALSLAENSANEAPLTTAAQTSGSRGQEVTNTQQIDNTMGTAAQVNATFGNIWNWARSAEGAPAFDWKSMPVGGQVEEKVVIGIARDWDGFADTADMLASNFKNAQNEYDLAKEAIAKIPTKTVPGEELVELKAIAANLEKERKAAFQTFMSISKEPPSPTKVARLKEAQMAMTRKAGEARAMSKKVTEAIGDPFWYDVVPGDTPPVLETRLQSAATEMADLTQQMAKHEQAGARWLSFVEEMPPSTLEKVKRNMGKGFQQLGNAFNIYTIGKSAANAGKNQTNNPAHGDIALTRTYGSTLDNLSGGTTVGGVFDLNLGFDLIGLATKDPLTAAAVTASSVTDIYYSARGYKAVLAEQAKAAGVARDLARKEKERYIFESNKAWLEFELEMAALGIDIYMLDAYADEADANLEEMMKERGLDPHEANNPDWTDPRIDPATGLPTPGYWAYLKENYPGTLASYGIDPEAPVGGWPGGIGPEHRPKDGKVTKEEAEKIKQRFEDEFDPKYPTRDPNLDRKPKNQDPKQPTEPELTDEERRELELEERRRKAQEELDAYQKEKIEREKREREEDRKDRTYDMRVSDLEISELIVTTFDLEPVEFEGPEFEMPEFDPPEFVPPGFDAPDASKFPPTDPDDTDGYPGTGEYPAFGYENMSGIVPTSLEPWAEWLATQDVKMLERLALQAGYPNLASALADAQNLIRYASDQGFRQWANQAPSCGGIVGCGPQYLERWAMKKSQVALGDILADSRDIFSTAGLSDIKMSGFLLSYIMRDYALEDGDIVDVVITQFGRKIFETRISLLNAGTDFNINLNPGVAAIEITAVNEGSAPPNTAAIIIDNVTEGESEQTYSLRTGETATLRVEPGQ